MLNFSTAIRKTNIDINECNAICIIARFRNQNPMDERLLRIKNNPVTQDGKEVIQAIFDENYKSPKEEINFLAQHIKKWADNRKSEANRRKK